MKVFNSILIFILVLINLTYSTLLHINETNSVNLNNKRSSKLSSTLWTDPYDDENGVWSKVLIDYTLSKTNRMSRMEGPHRYIPTSDFYITRRIDDMELDPLIRSPNPTTLQNGGGGVGNQNFQNFVNLPSNLQQGNLQQQHLPPMNRQIYPPNHRLREVSETDLYLLGAIEKLVYRVDYLENRIRRSEQLIYYLMAGNNEHKKELVSDPCPKNFTHIGDKCYHIAGDRQLNWKSANSLCKSMSSHLAEFISITENEEIVAYLLNHPGHRAKDFWLGGLNPGLLWIWSNSAKPVNPNTDLSTFTKNITTTTTTNEENIKNSYNKNENKILNNITEIKGNGRCLRLSYNPAKHKYFYYGQECTSRHHFICEFEDTSLDNKIKKIGRSLNLF